MSRFGGMWSKKKSTSLTLTLPAASVANTLQKLSPSWSWPRIMALHLVMFCNRSSKKMTSAMTLSHVTAIVDPTSAVPATAALLVIFPPIAVSTLMNGGMVSRIIVAETDATAAPPPSFSVTVMMLAPSTSPLTRALQAPPVITGALTVAAVLVEIVRVSPTLVNAPLMVWLEILVGVATLMFRKIGTTVTGTPVTINCACLFPVASTDKGAAVIPLRGELSSPFAEKFATVNAFKAGKLAPAATLNLTVTNSPGCSPAAFATTICNMAGAPAAAGTYLAAT